MADPCKPQRDLVAYLNDQIAKQKDALQAAEDDGQKTDPIHDAIRDLQAQLYNANLALRTCVAANPTPKPTPPSPTPHPTPPFQKPQWFEEGPGPTKINDPSYSKAAGAIQAIACDPVDVDRVFIGAVNGGIWTSNDASSAPSPSWVPQTDFLEGLSVSALAFSPLDPARNTLYAGWGATSSSGAQAGPLLGVLRTTDGGTTWTDPSAGQLRGVPITRILATGLADPQTHQEIVLVGTTQGLFRSVDAGATFVPVPQFAGVSIFDVQSEPTQRARIFVSTTSTITRSDDVGNQQWTPIQLPTQLANAGLGIRLSVCPLADATGNNWVYAGNNTAGLFASQDLGAPTVPALGAVTWISLGSTSPTGQGVGGMFVASPLLPTTLFCVDFFPQHWTVEATTKTWTPVDRNSTTSTGAHTDGRDMVFSASPDLMYEVNDGGIYRFINPHGRFINTHKQPRIPPRHWEEAVGNLRITEFYNIAYDSVNHVIFGAAQDQAVPHQTTPHDIDWQVSEGPESDGFRVGVDNTSTPKTSIHYSSSFPGFFVMLRNSFTSGTATLTNTAAQTLVNGTNGATIAQMEVNQGNNGTTLNLKWAVNKAQGKRVLVGLTCLYESSDQADNFDVLGGVMGTPPVPQTPLNGRLTAIAYGHRHNPDAIYVGTTNAMQPILVRGSGTGVPTAPAPTNPFHGATAVSIVMGPSDWQQVYVLDSQRQVWRSENAGASWTNLTGNLPSRLPPTFPALTSIEVYTPTPNVPGSAEVVFVGGFGGVFAALNPGTGKFAFWQKFGTFPNALVTDVHYDAKDDILLAGTIGRSAWSIRTASRSIDKAPSLKITAQGPSTCFGGWLENTAYGFSASIQGLSSLRQPLVFTWNVPPGVTHGPLDVPILSMTMPSAGQVVDVTLTVTDHDGYQVFGGISDHTLDARQASIRNEICDLLHKVQTSARFNWPIDPLGPPLRFENPADFERAMRELHDLAADLVRVTGHGARKRE